MTFSGDVTPVLAKHSKDFNLTHALEISVSDMQRNFDGMVQQVDRWRDPSTISVLTLPSGQLGFTPGTGAS
jgi:hypothetical protein